MKIQLKKLHKGEFVGTSQRIGLARIALATITNHQSVSMISGNG